MGQLPAHSFDDLRITINEGLRIARQRWRVALVGLSVVASVSFWGSQYVPREYSATTIFERRDDAVLQNLVQSRSPYSFDPLKATLVMDMTGSRALGRALITVGLLPEDVLSGNPVLSERERTLVEEAVRRWRVRTDVRLIHSSPSLDTIRLTCSANDPVVARQLAVVLRDQYVADARERMQEILHGARDFFANEVDRLQQRVAGADARLREGLGALPDVDPTDVAALGNRLELLRAQRDSAYQRRVALEADIAAREEFLNQALDTAVDRHGAAPVAHGNLSPLTDALLDQAIDQAQREIVNLMTLKRMTSEHPAVRAAQARLEQLELLRETVAGRRPSEAAEPATQPAVPIVSDVHRLWQLQRIRVGMELESLRRQLPEAERQLAEAERRLAECRQVYDRLVRQDDGLRATFDERTQAARELALWREHLATLERVLTAESGARGTQFALLEEPEEALRPDRPRVASVFAVCSGLGLAAAVMLAALAELLDRSFRSPGQVSRALGVPVLECIAVIPTPRERRRAWLSAGFWAVTLSVLGLLLVVSTVRAYTSLGHPVASDGTFERVRGALQLAGIAAGIVRAPVP